MKVENVPIDKITVGYRYRLDSGDLEGLATSIREMGLLQPIGIDNYYNLIFGARRITACKDILGWETIPCVKLKIESLLAGEYAENEFRKDFTASERVAIAKAIEAEIGKRRGRPSKEIKEKIPEFPKGKQTRDIAAKRAGFGNARTYEQAKKVVAKGAPETVAAMDAGHVSISAASAISSQPKEEQARILDMPKDQQREVVKRVRKTLAEKEASERRARDVYLFRGLLDAVQFLAQFSVDAAEAWDGLYRVSAYKFPEYLPLAIECLLRIKRERPNEPKKPSLLTKATP